MPKIITEEQFNKDKEIFKNSLNIELLIDFKDYKGIMKNYPYKCLKCGCENKKSYNNLKQNIGCPVCAKKMITEEIFIRDKEKIRNDLNIDLLINFNGYKGNKIKYPYKCLKCGYEDKKRYDDLKNGYGCPVCAKNKFISSLEEEIKEYIEVFYKKRIITSDRKILKPYELDIYLPDINLAVEFNGIYWHSHKIKKNKKYHYNKFEKCRKNNIRLYQIYEDEWNNNKEQIKECIRNLIENKEEYKNDNIVEINLDNGYNINKYIETGYKIKEIRENIMFKGGHKIYGSGIMILEK